MNHDRVYLQHILDAMIRIEEYLRDVKEQVFYRHYMAQDAVIRRLSVIGEAARRLSDGLRERYPHVPWEDVADIRDELVDDYLDVDVEAVWLKAVEDLPALKAHIAEILDDLGGSVDGEKSQ